MNKEIEKILNYLNEERGFDFSGYRFPMIERRISKRLAATKSTNLFEYLKYLEKHQNELNNLIDVLTINVSSFFRNTLTFEYIAARILPAIVMQKTEAHDYSLRVWSSGCSKGEEAYSVAILIHELMEKEDLKLDLNIFATDIDEATLGKAKEGVYLFESIKDIKYDLLKKYFTINNETYILNPEIKNMVNFSVYDAMDKKTYVPPESVFGNFDLVLCRNLLIYFQTEHQEIIFDKLLRSLAGNGYLVLGEAETLPLNYQKYFQKEDAYCHVYRKHR